MEIDKIIEQLSMTSCDCHCGYGEEKTTVECTQDCEYCKAVKAAIETMRKYQKIKDIYYHQSGQALENSLRAVIEDDNNE